MQAKKRLDITEDMLAQIQRVTATSVSASDIVIFEAKALSTNPLTKRGSIYHEARPGRDLLVEMAEGVRTGTHSVPLHTLHQQGYELPIGRVFDAQVVDEADGSSTLVAQFYLPASDEKLVNSIDLGILDEVSVGVLSKHAHCSACGFDYFAGENLDAIWDRTCSNGHTLGVDAHLNLKGLAAWTELSLVSRGASDKPKILSRVQPQMPQATYDRLAASGVSAAALMLFAATPMEKPVMSEKPVAAEAQDFDAKAAFEGLSAQIAELAAKIVEAPAPVEAQAPAAAPVEAEAEAEGEDLAAKLAAAEARIAELEAAAAAPPAAEPEAAPEPKVELAQELPVGGVAASAITDANRTLPGLSASAFKTKRR